MKYPDRIHHLPRQRKKQTTAPNASSLLRHAIMPHRRRHSSTQLQYGLVFALVGMTYYLFMYGMICQRFITTTDGPFPRTRRKRRYWHVRGRQSPLYFTAPIVYPHNRKLSHTHYHTPSEHLTLYLEPDFGGLHISSLHRNHWDHHRNVQVKTEESTLREYRTELLTAIEKKIEDGDDEPGQWYESFDDIPFDKTRQQFKWSYQLHPSCNTFHEAVHLQRPPSKQEYDIKFLDQGGFRDTFLLRPATTSTHQPLVLKTLRTKRDFDRYNNRNIAKEPLLMSMMNRTWTSTTYGHCATSVMVEKGVELWTSVVPTNGRKKTGKMPQEDLDALQKVDVKPQNQLSPSQQIEIALAMAQGIQELHSMGVVHADITLWQWLRSAHDNRVILNDFNHAEIMLWNGETSEYRKYYVHYDWGTSKAPEEYKGAYVERTADVWSFGNLLFTILTGLMPYYNIKHSDDVRAQIQKEPPYIDPRYQNRSLVEGRLYNIMKQCYQMEPTDRITMQQAVQGLRQLEKEYSKTLS